MKYFSVNELCRSDTAKVKGIDNSPIDDTVNAKLINLIEEVLDPMRSHLGKPINITSGYRSPELNKAIGGVSTSQHKTGEAADIVCSKLFNLFQWAVENLSYDQIIYEQKGNSKWIHASFVSCTENRNQALLYDNGVYTNYIR